MAERNATELGAALRAAGAAGARHVVRRHAETLDPFPGPDMTSGGGLLAASVGSDGTVRLDLVLRGQADAGGGLSYAQAAVQLCVTVTAAPGPGGEVRLDNLDCPASVAAPGLVDHEVNLATEGVLPPPPRRYPACHSGGDSDDCPGG